MKIINLIRFILAIPFVVMARISFKIAEAVTGEKYTYRADEAIEEYLNKLAIMRQRNK